MEKSFLYKGLFLIIMGIGLSSQCNAAAPDHDDASKAGDIIGQLSTCLGSNEGLLVYIAGTSFEAITDTLGNFKISYAQAGTYSLTVRRDGNEIGIIPNITVISRQTANVGTVSLCLDNDGDGYNQNVDCNDNNASINPDAEEVCGDGIDNNCNGEIDEGCSICTDNDSDGFYAQAGCGTLPDCNDTNSNINPNAPEICNNIDDNCDALIDNNAIEATVWYADYDQDGYGDDTYWERECIMPTGFTDIPGDCDDRDFNVNPSATEFCLDTIDNNCDGQINEGCP